MIFKKIFLLFIFLVWIPFLGYTQSTSNPADKIMKQVLLYKHINTPKKYQFTSYSNLLVTANPDKVQGNIDSVFVYRKNKKLFKSIDSSDYQFKKIISKQHLYQIEKVSRIISTNKLHQETILATKMAGFSEPIYEYYALKLQPFSLYDSHFNVVEKKYVSPITEKGFQKYNYTFLGSDILFNRKIDKIYFKAKRTNKIDKLEGVLYIDTEKHSIAKADLYVLGILNIHSVHEYEFNETLQNWFPNKTTLSLKKGKNKAPIKIFGETITFEGTNEKLNPHQKKFASDFLEIKLSTQVFDPDFDRSLKIKKPSIALKVDDAAMDQKAALWYKYYIDSTDVRSQPTYVSLDSLIKKRNIESKIKIGRKIIKGYYPISFFDFDLRYLAKYNNYEGFRLGFGGITNEKLSKRFKLEGYLAYGTKDGALKKYLSPSYRFDRNSATWIGISYKDDVSEIASTNFEIDKRVFKIYDPRPFNLSTFYNQVTWRGFVETKIIPKTEAVFQLSKSFVEPKFNYQFLYNNQAYEDFKASLFVASFQWNPWSKFMQTPNQQVEIDKEFPKFSFQFTKSIPGLWENSFDFGKLDFRVDFQQKFNSNHRLSFLLESGYSYGYVPLTHLYNHSPNNLTKNRLIQRITFAGKDSFETMYFNEFFSDKYLYFHIKHQFPKLEIGRQIKPVFSLVSRYGIGQLAHKESHQGFAFKTLDQGFYESGFEMNRIYKGIGLTAFYRYGPNQLSRIEDNIAVKLSVQFNLGFDN